ncbi:MAG: hypothetical protein LBD30_01840 [Verrucomicrobiales bacterium]|jgi:hypothetical protein|nr:hypothetical protein [Verrucomicrobiales bacterium]
MNLNEQKLQQLLRLKKLETPGKAYFSGFLAEFHRYQRAEMFRKASHRESLRSWLREFLFAEPCRAFAVCGGMAAVVALCVIGALSLFRDAADGDPAGYAKTGAASNVRLVSDSERDAPRYSTGQTPLSYDKTIAF